ncbi:hypothetical protein BcabD6B2_58810 (apicoplast) [Babesia caballi]|uniref:Ribosomal protein L6 n=1 Tax=Babesia caballi TaxID=5871 RepID=A0AAV4M252_BABCB|nr:hypothetical protein BcabD6B2_58810 [Babesia caballi]
MLYILKMIYIKNYYNKNFNKFIYLHVIDKYTKYSYISIFNNKFNNINNILILNKVILKIISNKPIFWFDNIKFIMFLKTFISKIYNIIDSITKTYKIDIQILNIFYKVIFIFNKLIIKVNNFINIIIYISNPESIKFNIQNSNNTLIFVSSHNKDFITSLCSIIVNSKKFNVYTNTGIKYLNKNIRIKKTLKLRKK